MKSKCRRSELPVAAGLFAHDENDPPEQRVSSGEFRRRLDNLRLKAPSRSRFDARAVTRTRPHLHRVTGKRCIEKIMNFFVESLLLGILLQRLLVRLHRNPMSSAGQLNAHNFCRRGEFDAPGLSRNRSVSLQCIGLIQPRKAKANGIRVFPFT